MRHCEAPLDECVEICSLGRTIDGAGLVITDNDNHIISVAHYIVGDNGCAEPAIIVADDYQSRGIGTRLFKKSGFKFKSTYEYGQNHIQIDLNVTNDTSL